MHTKLQSGTMLPAAGQQLVQHCGVSAQLVSLVDWFMTASGLCKPQRDAQDHGWQQGRAAEKRAGAETDRCNCLRALAVGATS